MENINLVGALGLADRFKTAGIVTLQGMMTIFLVLLMLWVSIEIMHLVIHRKRNKKSESKSAKTNWAEDASTQAPPNDTDEGAIIAAITAAVTAFRDEAGESGAFRVVSFARASSARRRR